MASTALATVGNTSSSPPNTVSATAAPPATVRRAPPPPSTSALASATVRAAVESGAVWRESYVATTIGDRIVEGYVDLVYRGPDGLVVVDYKTDAIASEVDLAAKLDRYRLQGATYALAMQRATGEAVAAMVFIFCREGVAREVAVDDLGAAMAAVEAIAAG